VKDELADRRAAKGIMTISIKGGGSSVVREVELPAQRHARSVGHDEGASATKTA